MLLPAPPNHSVRVRVTILDAPPSSMGISQGQTMAAALERLAAKNGSSQLPDRAALERQIRQDRPLPRHET